MIYGFLDYYQEKAHCSYIWYPHAHSESIRVPPFSPQGILIRKSSGRYFWRCFIDHKYAIDTPEISEKDANLIERVCQLIFDCKCMCLINQQKNLIFCDIFGHPGNDNFLDQIDKNMDVETFKVILACCT